MNGYAKRFLEWAAGFVLMVCSSALVYAAFFDDESVPATAAAFAVCYFLTVLYAVRGLRAAGRRTLSYFMTPVYLTILCSVTVSAMNLSYSAWMGPVICLVMVVPTMMLIDVWGRGEA